MDSEFFIFSRNRYICEYAICVRDHCLFISIDDKHKVQIGEPDCPVTAERGRRVPVRSDEAFTVADHDFTKFALIPSVVFIIDVPEEISNSWYHGKKKNIVHFDVYTKLLSRRNFYVYLVITANTRLGVHFITIIIIIIGFWHTRI